MAHSPRSNAATHIPRILARPTLTSNTATRSLSEGLQGFFICEPFGLGGRRRRGPGRRHWVHRFHRPAIAMTVMEVHWLVASLREEADDLFAIVVLGVSRIELVVYHQPNLRPVQFPEYLRHIVSERQRQHTRGSHVDAQWPVQQPHHHHEHTMWRPRREHAQRADKPDV